MALSSCAVERPVALLESPLHLHLREICSCLCTCLSSCPSERSERTCCLPFLLLPFFLPLPRKIFFHRRVAHLWVTHLRDGLIVAKVGIARQRDRSHPSQTTPK